MILVIAVVSLLMDNTVAMSNDCPKETDFNANRTYCRIQRINSFPNNFKSETELTSNTTIKQLRNYVFAETGFVDLEVIIMRSVDLEEVQEFAFSGQKTLKHLDLSNNELTTVPSNIFADNPQLEFVDLSANKFKTLHSYQFASLPSLKFVNLSDCRVHRIHKSAFYNLPKIESINLSVNHLNTLSTDIFVATSNLKLVNVDYNPLECDEHTLHFINTPNFRVVTTTLCLDIAEPLTVSDTNSAAIVLCIIIGSIATSLTVYCCCCRSRMGRSCYVLDPLCECSSCCSSIAQDNNDGNGIPMNGGRIPNADADHGDGCDCGGGDGCDGGDCADGCNCSCFD